MEYLGAVALTPVLVAPQETNGMWGLIAKITILPGKRDEMIAILRESAAEMPGCLSYVVAKDAADENAIPRGKAVVSNFERIAVTSPVWGAGLPTAKAH